MNDEIKSSQQLTTQKSNIVNFEKGKIPPQAVDFEQVVLGALLIDKKAINQVIHLLSTDVFYFDKHQIIFEAIQRLYDIGSPVDILTVSEQLSKMEKLEMIGGDFYLVSLTEKVFSSAHIEYHSFIILQKFILRKIIQAGHIAIEQAYEPDFDVLEIVENFEEEMAYVKGVSINKALEWHEKGSADDLTQQLDADFERIQRGETIGIPIGLNEIDDFTQGLQPIELVIIGGRPGMGKTSLAIIIAVEISFRNQMRKGVFFSLEMSKRQLMNRIISKETGIPYQSIKFLKITPEQKELVKSWYRFFEERSNLKIVDNLETLIEIVDYILKEDVEFAFIDYLQLMKLDKALAKKAGNREQEVGLMSKTLKSTAKKKGIPIIALSQLSRSVEQRANKRPLLSDLRESGSLEQDADTVYFVYRDAYYRKGQFVPEIEEGNIDLILAKGRETGEREFKLHLDNKSNVISEGHKFQGSI